MLLGDDAYKVMALMPQLVPSPARFYASPVAKTAARKGDGPWGEAIQYWFKDKHLRQSHVVEGTGMSPNKASRAANGLDVRMETLRQFAEFFEVPLESVLVSPERRLSPDVERKLTAKLAEDVSSLLERARPTTQPRRLDPRLQAIAKRIGRLTAKQQKALLSLLSEYEKRTKTQAK